MVMRSAILNVMGNAALKAARGLIRDFGEVEQLQVSVKGPGDFVSTADLKAERILKAELTRARPGYALLFEEGGAEPGSDPRHRWIVDPLDGTTNFLHGIPHFAISIALERDGEIVAGVVYDPTRDEMYLGREGSRRLCQRPPPAGFGPAPARRRGDRHRHPVRRARRASRSISTPWRRSWRRPAACGAWARRRSTSPMSLPAGSTASGSSGCSRGISPPGCCWCARPAAMSAISPAATR